MNTEQLPPQSGISIIIPAHNEEYFIGDTIRSIQTAQESIKSATEIIVVNDASTDETASIATNLGARVRNVELRNIALVRNAGAEIAKFDHFVFLDADTCLPAKTLAATERALLDEGWVGGGAWVEFDSEGNRVFFLKRWMAIGVRFIWQTVGGWAAGCYVFCRRDAFEKTGGFPGEYFAAEEYFISRNLKNLGKFKILRESVVTSSRKLHDYSTWELVKFVTSPLTQIRGPLRSRKGLDLLYNHVRSRPKNQLTDKH